MSIRGDDNLQHVKVEEYAYPSLQLEGTTTRSDKRKQWSKEDDDIIIKFVAMEGTKRWSKIAELLPGRTPKQCRTR